MKFCVHFQVGKVYYVNEIKKLILICLLFQIFNFSFCHSYITHMDIFHQNFLRNYLIKHYEIFNNFIFSLKVLQPLMATDGYVSFAHFLLYLHENSINTKILCARIFCLKASRKNASENNVYRSRLLQIIA